MTETDPIDFFVYDDEQAFREALGPGLRENVAGTAFAENRTMYAYITPDQVGQDWVDILVTHELTHLVFDTATQNIYRPAPHWLNEGIAVYLSEGFSERWQVSLGQAKGANALIPLQGMVATFGAGDQRFDYGYAESVSAVDYFVKTYGEPKLWGLIRSYSEGLSDDDAFSRATGLDLPGFNAAWMKSIGAGVPAELGPQPGPTSPAGVQSGPRPTGAPASEGPGAAGAFGAGSFVLGLVVIVVVVLAALRFARRRPPRRRSGRRRRCTGRRPSRPFRRGTGPTVLARRVHRLTVRNHLRLHRPLIPRKPRLSGGNGGQPTTLGGCRPATSRCSSCARATA